MGEGDCGTVRPADANCHHHCSSLRTSTSTCSSSSSKGERGIRSLQSSLRNTCAGELSACNASKFARVWLICHLEDVRSRQGSCCELACSICHSLWSNLTETLPAEQTPSPRDELCTDKITATGTAGLMSLCKRKRQNEEGSACGGADCHAPPSPPRNRHWQEDN